MAARVAQRAAHENTTGEKERKAGERERERERRDYVAHGKQKIGGISLSRPRDWIRSLTMTPTRSVLRTPRLLCTPAAFELSSRNILRNAKFTKSRCKSPVHSVLSKHAARIHSTVFGNRLRLRIIYRRLLDIER